MVTSTSLNSDVRDQLLAEHAGLSRLMGVCEQEAERILTGEINARQLLACVLQLLDAVENHNQVEEEALRPLLLDTDSFGPVRIEQMIDDHIAEHMWLRQLLREAVEFEIPDRAARATINAMRLLRGRMKEEEAQFLNQDTLRDDLVAIDGSSG
jgi:hemerythrin-like domain-containing protein